MRLLPFPEPACHSIGVVCFGSGRVVHCGMHGYIACFLVVWERELFPFSCACFVLIVCVACLYIVFFSVCGWAWVGPFLLWALFAGLP